ncbi:MAG: hypothetical protein M0P74_00810 [Syntrophales bacterium]|jgi:hypothetical protein|nr:hypothetical protein [Syntrophales bacterium]
MSQVKRFLIIAGAAPCVLEDLEKISSRERFDFMLIGAGSPAAETIPVLKCHVSHENDFPAIRELRKLRGLNTDYLAISNNVYEGVDCVYPEFTPPTCARECRPRLGSRDPRNHHHYSGSSAMLGLKVALRLGYRKIVLAGVPIDEGRYAAFQVGWCWIADLLRCCPVRSMSGFTRELLGPYTEDWLNE